MGGRHNAKPTDLCLWGRGLCGLQLTAAPYSSVGPCTADSHVLSVPATPGLGTSACDSPAVTLTRLERREPSVRLCKPQDDLRTAGSLSFRSEIRKA